MGTKGTAPRSAFAKTEWKAILELAARLDAEASAGRNTDGQAARRLAHAIIAFDQTELLSSGARGERSRDEDKGEQTTHRRAR